MTTAGFSPKEEHKLSSRTRYRTEDTHLKMLTVTVNLYVSIEGEALRIIHHAINVNTLEWMNHLHQHHLAPQTTLWSK